MKNNRQKIISDLIAENEIATQEELMELLSSRGYAVAQATVSRDLRQLRVTKLPTGHGKYKYALPAAEKENVFPKFNPAFIDSIKSVDSAMNILVLKTYTGMAQAVATGIDAIESEDILGCVAGDDTIFMCIRNPEAAAGLCDKIRELLSRV